MLLRVLGNYNNAAMNIILHVFECVSVRYTPCIRFAGSWSMVTLGRYFQNSHNNLFLSVVHKHSTSSKTLLKFGHISSSYQVCFNLHFSDHCVCAC